jgi:hypothetical protein
MTDAEKLDALATRLMQGEEPMAAITATFGSGPELIAATKRDPVLKARCLTALHLALELIELDITQPQPPKDTP